MNYPFAVQQMRRLSRPDGSRIAPECRNCRYCQKAVESEVHVVFECEGLDDMVVRRDDFIQHAEYHDVMTWYEGIRNPLQAIHYFVEHDLAPAFAKFLFDVFRMFPLKIALKTFRQDVEEPY